MFYSYPYKALSFPIQCVWLKLNGSWPLTESSMPWRSQSFLATAYNVWAWYVIASVGITISYQTAFLLNNLSDIIITTENCCTTFMGVLNFVRLIHLRLNQRKFRQLIENFSYEIWIPDSSKNNVAAECRRRMVTFSIMTSLLSCLIIMYCVLPLVEIFFGPAYDAQNKPFPYKMIFPYDAQSSWIRYVMTYIFTSLRGNLRGIFAGSNEELAENIQLERLKCIVEKHNNIISFAKRLEDFFNPILLANLMISSVLICMVGFQIITSTLTAQILYECQWEGSDRFEIHSFTPTSKRIRNQIWFMILCSQQPVRITAFKFSTLSLQSFTAILSTSISYFTLLRSVYFDDEKKLD
ncbi:GD17258 [Drosophila simulans]|uniref:Odorant receptor n=1 Tax=Drosophila simulans TaxID=7240 RepID=B4R5K3_DROSI|nr:GD17258 [Drosophila simulans]